MKRVYTVILAMFAVTLVMAKDSYLAACVDGREYIYKSDTDTIRKNTYKSERSPYYIYYASNIDDEYAPFTTMLKDSANLILRHHPSGYYDHRADSVISIYANTVGDNTIYFDYNLEVGDNLYVIESMGVAINLLSNESLAVSGKKITPISIERIEIDGMERLKYNLQSQAFSLDVDIINMSNSTPPGVYHELVEYDYLYNEAWIEGIGYTTYAENYHLQCAFENGENIYTAEGAVCNGLSDNINEKIDFATLTLHRSGDVLMAAFPAAGEGEAITLYDATGRAVTCQPIREGATTASIDVATLPKGVYIARLASGAAIKVAI